MTRPTDEVLMAYADGALSETEAAEVATVLQHDAEARATVAEFRRTAALARAAYADIAAEPAPERLVRAVLGSDVPSANITDLGAARTRRSSQWRTALPLAASLALIIGLGTALLLREMAPGTPSQIMALGPVPKSNALADVLERQPSGAPIAIAPTQEVERLMVVATFSDRKARVCREVEALDKHMQAAIAGVACRNPANGTWIVEGMARIASPVPPGGSDFVPSGAEQKDALDGLLGILGASKALTAEEEQRLLAKGWR